MNEKHKSDLYYSEQEAKAVKKLNDMTYMPKTYKDTLAFQRGVLSI